MHETRPRAAVSPAHRQANMSTTALEVPSSYPYPEPRMPEDWEMNQLAEEEYEAYCRDVLRDML